MYFLRYKKLPIPLYIVLSFIIHDSVIITEANSTKIDTNSISLLN